MFNYNLEVNLWYAYGGGGFPLAPIWLNTKIYWGVPHSSGGLTKWRHVSILFYLYLFHNKPYNTEQREKQWNKTDKTNSSYSRPTKRENKNKKWLDELGRFKYD